MREGTAVKFNVRVLGGILSVTLDSSIPADVQSAIARQWQHLREDASAQASEEIHLAISRAAVPVDTETALVVARDEQHAPDLLASNLTLAGIRQLAGTAFMFHAAGLAAADGRVVALVGPSGRGKTTAARALGRTMGYVSDETVAFTPDLGVIPYPKPLSIGHRPGVKALSAPGDLGLRVADEPLRLGALVLLDRRTEPTDPRAEDVPLIDAIGDLVEQSSSFSSIRNPLGTLAEVVAAAGGVRRLVYSEAADLEALVASVLEAPSRSETLVDGVAAQPVIPTSSGAVGRAPFVDARWIDGRLAILTQRRLQVLDGIGPELWLLADGVSLEDLSDRLLRQIGEPPADVDLSRAVDDAVTAMVDADLLRRG